MRFAKIQVSPRMRHHRRHPRATGRSAGRCEKRTGRIEVDHPFSPGQRHRAGWQGQPITDLKKEDFRIKVNGKDQPIKVFSMD